MWQWMGNMFCRGQPINVIYAMTFSELKMWNEWHETMYKAEEKTANSLKGKK
jgi:hypothetical protein